MFWFRILMIGQVALLARRHLSLLEPGEQSKLAKLVAKSRGRPRTNLTADERQELLALAQKLEPSAFAQGAWAAARGRAKP